MDKNETLTPKVALLIDGDNISPDFIQKVLAKAKKFGTLVIKRVYADFTQPQHAPWKNTILDNGLHAMHTFAYTKGKNTTDIALVIDAMDLMCAKKPFLSKASRRLLLMQIQCTEKYLLCSKILKT